MQKHKRTMTGFTLIELLVVISIIALLAALALTLGAQMAAVYWAPLQVLLQTVPIGSAEWTLIALFVLPILIVPEVLKAVRARAGGRHDSPGADRTNLPRYGTRRPVRPRSGRT